MRWIVVTLIVLTMLASPGLASAAEVVDWDPGAPKGVIGADGIACHGEATVQDVTYRYTNYIGADAGEMTADSARERSWQNEYCRYILETDMVRWFKFARGLDLDPSTIKMTIKRL